MRMFPTLYKIDSKGKVREWNITVNIGGCYTVTHGARGGAMQSTTVQCEQKNVGKANETSLDDQAMLEAESKWKKQQDKGYRPQAGPIINGAVEAQNLEDAKRFLPMLAKSFGDYSHKVTFPCHYQPKLDGIRCVAYIDSCPGYYTPHLLSRKGKPFPQLLHIENAVINVLRDYPDWILDGELYSDTLDFQTITSIVRKGKTADPRAEQIQYHVYDCFSLAKDLKQMCFTKRAEQVAKMLQNRKPPMVQVHTDLLSSEDEVALKLKEYEDKGYEGIMIRNSNGTYENDRRSENLQKVKSFQDDEFVVVGCNQGIGKFEGLAIFQCQTKDGKTFSAAMMGSTEQRRDYYDNRDKYTGEMLTVKFFEYSKDGVPRFPIGVVFRTYE